MSESAASIAERGGPFQAEAADVLRRLRTQVAALFVDLPGGVRKSRDVQKVLGVDARLSWQLFKLAGPGEAMTLAPHVPSATSMRRLLAAAGEHGIAADKVEGVRRAFEAFERLVATHAGDRASFDSMARGFLEGDGGTQSDLLHRKAIFKGHSHYYGAQTQTLAGRRSSGPAPGRTGSTSSTSGAGWASAACGPTPTRSSTRCARRCRTHVGRHAGRVVAARRRRAGELPRAGPARLLHAAAAGAADRRPRGRHERDRAGRRRGRQAERGRHGVRPGDPRRARRPPRPRRAARVRHAGRDRQPTALLIFDMLVHRGAFPHVALAFDVLAYGNTPAHHARLPALRLPFSERIASLGDGVDALLTRELPRYPELVEYACRKVGWTLDDFAIYRARIEFPMLDTFPTISVRVLD